MVHLIPACSYTSLLDAVHMGGIDRLFDPISLRYAVKPVDGQRLLFVYPREFNDAVEMFRDLNRTYMFGDDGVITQIKSARERAVKIVKRDFSKMERDAFVKKYGLKIYKGKETFMMYAPLYPAKRLTCPVCRKMLLLLNEVPGVCRKCGVTGVRYTS